MTAAQKKNQATFKKAIAYRKKTGCTLKQAFAYAKGGKVAAGKKKIGALPNMFTGKILDVPFKVSHQYDIYGKVNSILEDTNTGKTILIIDGTGDAKEKTAKFLSHVKKETGQDYTGTGADYKGDKSIFTRVNKFITQLQSEVKKFNSGKSRTIKKLPVKIESVKKIPAKKQTGKSNQSRDKLYQAKKPGKRKSASGRTYYESRANRSDQGQLLGIHKDSKSHNVNIRVVSGIGKLSAGAKKLWIDINKKGYFNFNTEENILLFLYDEAVRKGQYKKAEYLRELYDNIVSN
jgi:hypothetical protein